MSSKAVHPAVNTAQGDPSIKLSTGEDKWTDDKGKLLQDVQERLRHEIADPEFKFNKNSKVLNRFLFTLTLATILPLRESSPFKRHFNLFRKAVSLWLLIVVTIGGFSVVYDFTYGSEEQRVNLIFQIVCLSWMASMAFQHAFFAWAVESRENSILIRVFCESVRTTKQQQYLEKLLHRLHVGIFVCVFMANSVMLFVASYFGGMGEMLTFLMRGYEENTRLIANVVFALIMVPFSAIWGLTFPMFFIPGWLYAYRYSVISKELAEASRQKLAFEPLKVFLRDMVTAHLDIFNSVKDFNQQSSKVGVMAMIGYGIPILLLLIELTAFEYTILRITELFWFVAQFTYLLLLSVPAALVNSFSASLPEAFAQVTPSPFSPRSACQESRFLLTSIVTLLQTNKTSFRLANFVEVTFSLLIQGISFIFSVLLLFGKLTKTS